MTKKFINKQTKKEQNGRVEVVFILDRSGSMSGLEADTVGGFNSILKKQKKEPGEVIWSTVLFDDKYEVIHDRVPIKQIEKLTENEYYVRGSTALLDAVGRTINHIANIHKHAGLKDIPEKTMFVIMTDGMENASFEYTYGAVKKMIKRQQDKYGWEFLFLGANMDAVSVAGRMDIGSNRSATFHNDSMGIKTVYSAVNKAMNSLRFEDRINDTVLEEVNTDYNNRLKKR